ncbi:Tat pathway signal sequence domain protein [Phenylobacterium sp.]|uniref:Tat pathway signal sequence domain protein n=1 Tax=Phenylobacterium sp. TaxID=1871053 RepID=UPI002625D14D|nr:Tat pathway signal sequence domain protein [Phenylobacterium sp.]
MRRYLLAALTLALAAASVPADSLAQSRGQTPEDRAEQAGDRRQRQTEWGDRQAPLPQLRNAGPCPYVKVLYDAGRYVEFAGGQEASAAVGYSGEIQGISAGCSYEDEEPIQVVMELLFELGRGPTAQGSQKTYRYWVAVTKRNDAVIAKEYFDLPVTFSPGEDRTYVRQMLEGIVIPRAQLTTSGANFEVLVGFDVTPEMAEFNRAGKRFRIDVGTDVAAGTAQTNQ